MKTIKFASFNKGKRVTALLIIAAFLITICAPIPVRASSLKEEVVYVRLNNDGSLKQVYVVNSFELDENNQILDYGNYSYVQNLTDNSEIRLKDGKVTIDAQGSQLYYEGFLVDPVLPWDISIKYILDGQEIFPDDIPGQTGRLNIEVETGANPLGSKDFFDSYALQLAITLDSSICKNISAKGGTVATAGGSKQVNYVILPGKAAKLELSADVESFEMPAITIGGVRLDMDFSVCDYDMSDLDELTDGIADLDEGVQELLDGIFDMKEGVSDLHDGSKELKDGVGEFKDGIAELSDGTGELLDGVSELKDGTIEMADGASELADGTTELVDGVRELDDGVGEFADGIDELYDGINELLLGISKLNGGMGEITGGSEDLKEGAGSLASGAAAAASGGGQLAGGFSAYFEGIITLVNSQLAGSGIPGLPLTRANYQEVLENALYGEAIATARATIKAGVYAAARQSILEAILMEMGMSIDEYNFLPDDEAKASINAAVDAQLSGMQDTLDAQVDAALADQMPAIRQGVANAPEAQQLLGLLDMLEGYNQLLYGLNEYVAGVNGISAGTKSFSAGVSKFHSGLLEYEDGLSDYQSGMAQFHRESQKLVDGANELKDGTVELLEGVIELKDGVVEFKDGLVELRDGVIELFDGIVELHDGVIEMNDGAIELNDGVIELTDGVGELKKGTNELYDGVAELKDGTGELRRETQSLGTKIIEAIEEELDKMLGRDAPVKSFVSDKNGEISAVQFVMQTEGISAPEVEAVVAQSEPELTFWQRFIRLFGF